jgi:hypothetical protein
MTITRLLGVAIAVGLLLANSVTSSAARQSRHLSGTHAQASVKEDRGVVAHPSHVRATLPELANELVREKVDIILAGDQLVQKPRSMPRLLFRS